MSYIKKILIVVAMLGLVFCGIKVYDIVQIFNAENTAFNNDEAYVYIPTGLDPYELQHELFPLLKDEEKFRIVAKRLGYDREIKPGKFTLKKGMSNLEIVRTLQGKSDFVTVIIPDSNEIDLLSKQISTQIEAEEIELFTVLEDTLFLLEKELMFPALYQPGTYKMPWNTTAEAFRDRIYEASQKENKAN